MKKLIYSIIVLTVFFGCSTSSITDENIQPAEDVGLSALVNGNPFLSKTEDVTINFSDSKERFNL